MGFTSTIQWTDASWTPVRARRKDNGKVGVHCERISDGCKHCYSATFNKRLLPNHGTGLDFVRSSRALVDIFLDENILEQPFHWRKPKKIFVCSQTDLFADFVTEQSIANIFAVMGLCEGHQFQVLTKRAVRMAGMLNHDSFWEMVGIAAEYYAENIERLTVGQLMGFDAWWQGVMDRRYFPNVWLGVSVENQEWADERIPLLLRTPAALRFVSYEPALGQVDFQPHWFDPIPFETTKPDPRIDWIIVGGESGPSARPFNIDWARSTISQAHAFGPAKVFVKQLGEYPVWDGSGLVANNPHVPMEKVVALGKEMWRLHPSDKKGGNVEEFPFNLQVREFPQ